MHPNPSAAPRRSTSLLERLFGFSGRLEIRDGEKPPPPLPPQTQYRMVICIPSVSFFNNIYYYLPLLFFFYTLRSMIRIINERRGINKHGLTHCLALPSLCFPSLPPTFSPSSTPFLLACSLAGFRHLPLVNPTQPNPRTIRLRCRRRETFPAPAILVPSLSASNWLVE
ncbi:hypothetical protein IWX48DRAFT_455047 [Phyllosticta citricarpa]